MEGPSRNDVRVPWDAETSRVLGQRVRQLREERRITQEALAHEAGCSKNHVQVIEAAARPGASRVVNLRLTTLYGIAEALGVEPFDLVRDV